MGRSRPGTPHVCVIASMAPDHQVVGRLTVTNDVEVAPVILPPVTQ
jgi:hypothetical protein